MERKPEEKGLPYPEVVAQRIDNFREELAAGEQGEHLETKDLVPVVFMILKDFGGDQITPKVAIEALGEVALRSVDVVGYQEENPLLSVTISAATKIAIDVRSETRSLEQSRFLEKK